MKNLKESGDRFEIALTADTAPGEVVIAGELVGVAINGGKAGARDVILRRGAFEFPKATGALSIGDRVYWSPTDKHVTATEVPDAFVGWAFDNAAVGDATAMVVLKG